MRNKHSGSGHHNNSSTGAAGGGGNTATGGSIAGGGGGSKAGQGQGLLSSSPPVGVGVGAGAGASTYSSLLSSDSHNHALNAAYASANNSSIAAGGNPFKYSKEEMLQVWREGGGRGPLGLEVELWEGVVKEVGGEPVGIREMSDAEKKVRISFSLISFRLFVVFRVFIVWHWVRHFFVSASFTRFSFHFLSSTLLLIHKFFYLPVIRITSQFRASSSPISLGLFADG